MIGILFGFFGRNYFGRYLWGIVDKTSFKLKSKVSRYVYISNVSRVSNRPKQAPNSYG